MNRTTTSASSIEKFTQCPAAWITNYDEDFKVSTRNFYSEIGNLIHRALELWDSPGIISGEQDYESLERCFDRACVDLAFGQTHEQYARAKELLLSAYRLCTTHPTVPMNLAVTLSCEQELFDNLDDDDWNIGLLRVRGSIDKVAYIPNFGKNAKPNEIILLAIDYKTGQPKTHNELTKEEIQAPLYHAWMRKVLIPELEEQGHKVVRLLMVWTYIKDGSAVTMFDDDFDDLRTINFVNSISAQMVRLQNDWNQIEKNEKDQKEFLSNHEKPNAYCSYCPRKGECKTFSSLLSFKSVIDITDPNVTWEAIWADYEKYQAINKMTEQRLDEIKRLVPVYLDHEGLPSIKLADGREIAADQQTRKEYRPEIVEQILGREFIMRSAKVTKDAIEKEIALIAKTDPKRAQEITTELQSAYTTYPGPRPVKARKVK